MHCVAKNRIVYFLNFSRKQRIGNMSLSRVRSSANGSLISHFMGSTCPCQSRYQLANQSKDNKITNTCLKQHIICFSASKLNQEQQELQHPYRSRSRVFSPFLQRQSHFSRKNGKIVRRSIPNLFCEQSRCQSTRSPDTVMNVFDRKAKRLQRNRAALSYVGEDVSVYDYLKDEFGYRLSDRICDIKRVFNTAVDLGCGRGHLSKNLYLDMVKTLYQCELSSEMLLRADPSPEVPTHRLIVDEEFLPFRDGSVDIVVSNLSLHWVNDLPRSLKQILQALRNDGVLIGTMFGGDTLYELRVSLQLAEQEREGGFAPHISPYTTVNDLGNLLTRAGFTLLTIDIDGVTINYPSLFELMYDLKGMAENNCSWSRKPQLHRDTLIAAASIYKDMYGNEDGIPATFQVINFIGWKPDPSQPQAAKRGSATVSIKDIGRLDELTKEMENLHKDRHPSGPAKEKLTEDLQTFAKKLGDAGDDGKRS